MAVTDQWQCLSIKKGKTCVNYQASDGQIQCGTCYYYHQINDTWQNGFPRVRKRFTTIKPMQDTCPFCGAWLYWRHIKVSVKKSGLGRKIKVDKSDE